MISSIEDLKELMRIPPDALPEEIRKRFEDIADALINHVYIQYGEQRYYFEEIEFYYYNKNHRDLITYPRKSGALQWFRNFFDGVDLTFESNMELSDCNGKELYDLNPDSNPSFGGILIRQISDEGKKLVATGPLLSANKLFKLFDATCLPKDFPVLKYDADSRGLEKESKQRINILPTKKKVEEKVENVLSNNKMYTNEPKKDLYSTYITLSYNAKYRYRTEKAKKYCEYYADRTM
jgi:hypothetical protein